MSHLYGDSTTFPYDVDYIDLSRHAVDCAVQLFSAQQAIGSALERAEGQDRLRIEEQARLTAMSEAVENALLPFLRADSEQTTMMASRILECSKNAANEELASGDRRANDVTVHAKHVVQSAGESARRSLETFLTRYDLPETEVSLVLTCAGEHSHSGQVNVRSPFGVSAGFSLRIPPDHAWSRPRRVAELAPGLEVHLPQQAGWISKRVEMAPVKLDRLYFSSVKIAGTQLELSLRKSPNSGAGYRLLVDLRGGHGAQLAPFDDSGPGIGTLDAEPPLTLEGEDGARMLQLAQRVIESIHGLAYLRGSMLELTLDDQPPKELEWPEIVAERLIGHLAPVVTEISRRSGAPGELVLRKDVGDGRRDEMYVTKAELWQKLLVLPPERRAAFAALGLCEPPRGAVVEPFASLAAAPAPSSSQKPRQQKDGAPVPASVSAGAA
jgi:hypothetical protein